MSRFSPSYVFYGLLYLLQGAVLAYISNFQKPYLAEQGISPQRIGALTGALLLPFVAKIFLGALSDRVGWGPAGRRRPYLVLGLLVAGGSYWAIAGVPPGAHFGWFLGLSIVAIFGFALFDTACDGLALDAAPPEKEDATQASMMIGKGIGYILFSSLFGWIALHYGIREIFWCLSALALVIALISLGVNEPPIARGVHPKVPWRLLRSPLFILFFLIGATHTVSSFGADGLISWFLKARFHLDSLAVGRYGSFRGLGALIGAFATVPLIRWVGYREAFLGALVTMGLALWGISLMPAGFPLVILGLGWGVVWGITTTVFLALMMRHSRGVWSATLFALCAMACNIGTGLGEWLAPSSVAVNDFAWTFRYLSLGILVPLFLSVIYFARIKNAPEPFL